MKYFNFPLSVSRYANLLQAISAKDLGIIVRFIMAVYSDDKEADFEKVSDASGGCDNFSVTREIAFLIVQEMLIEEYVNSNPEG